MEQLDLEKITINMDESMTISAPKDYAIDIDKVNSMQDIATLFKALISSFGELRINERSPYYEDLYHLRKDEE